MQHESIPQRSRAAIFAWVASVLALAALLYIPAASAQTPAGLDSYSYAGTLHCSGPGIPLAFTNASVVAITAAIVDSVNSPIAGCVNGSAPNNVYTFHAREGLRLWFNCYSVTNCGGHSIDNFSVTLACTPNSTYSAAATGCVCNAGFAPGSSAPNQCTVAVEPPPSPPPPPPPPPPPEPPHGCAAGAGGFTSCPPGAGVPPPKPTDPRQGTPKDGGATPNAGAPGTDSSPESWVDPDEPDDAKEARSCTSAQAVGDPVFPGIGNVFEEEVDYRSPAGLHLVRRYNSALPGWVHNWSGRILANASTARVVRPDGRINTFTANAAGQWVGEPTAVETLRQVQAGGTQSVVWQYTTAGDAVEQYDAEGRLLSIAARAGRSYVARHSEDLLQSVSDAFGRTLQFAYDPQRRLTGVRTPEGTLIAYAYDVQGRLAEVLYPDGTRRAYLYENTAFPLALTGIVDARGIRISSWRYDADGRAASSERAGTQRYTFAYATDGTTTIVDPLGVARVQRYAAVGARKVFAGQSPPCANCWGDAASNLLDAATGLVTQSVDSLGVVSTYAYEKQRHLPLSATLAAGLPEERTARVEWHAVFRLPVRVERAGRVTSYSYDAAGNMLSESAADSATGESRTRSWSYDARGMVQAHTDTNGRVWKLGRDGAGNLASVTDPLGRETRYTYDAAGRVLTQAAPGRALRAYAWDVRGRLVGETAGTELTAYTYNAAGRLASATFPSGHALAYSYDTAARLVHVADNRGATVRYTLDAAGNRVREEVSDANGALALAVTRVYDTLDRLASVQGASGQAVRYAYDANGELIAESDPLNQTTRRAVDGLRRQTGLTHSDGATTGTAWDANDALVRVTDPKGVATHYMRNGFGDVESETSRDIGALKYRRDGSGRVNAIEDAKGRVTQITRDALGRAVEIRSGADKATFLSYDGAGDLIAAEDEAGNLRFDRDEHGRITRKQQVVNDDPARPASRSVGYAYAGGELASVTYPSGLTVTYRRTLGRVTGIDVQRAGQQASWFVSALAYTALGQPKSWTWSNGDSALRSFDTDGRLATSELASYGYDAAGRITMLTQQLWAQRVVDGIAQAYRLPMTWTASYDNRNRLVSFARSGAVSRYSYDANGNRLTAVDIVSGASDLEGLVDGDNRVQTTTQALRTEPDSNRLLGFTQTTTTVQNKKKVAEATTQVGHDVDANGAITGDGLRTFVYDERNRLARVDLVKNDESAGVSYLHNALGQRTFKSEVQAQQTLPREDTLGSGFVNWLRKNFNWMFTRSAREATLGTAFVYGDGPLPTWALLGDYGNGSASSSPTTEYLWLPTEGGAAIPIGMYREGVLYAVHADHLGAPRLITDALNKPVWQWPYSAFGNNSPTGVLSTSGTAPSSADGAPAVKGTKPLVEVHLRGPGQYHDKESALTYNFHRSLLADGSRYSQPDPIGLGGGDNRFRHASASPLNYADPRGLLVPAIGPLMAWALPIAAASSLASMNPRAREALERASDALTTWAKAPQNAYDPDGPKAPGKPGADEGFKDPARGESWVPNPNPGRGGASHGWRDDRGRVWCPTGKGGRAHGGPHWDVQLPSGGNVNVPPGQSIHNLHR